MTWNPFATSCFARGVIHLLEIEPDRWHWCGRSYLGYWTHPTHQIRVWERDGDVWVVDGGSVNLSCWDRRRVKAAVRRCLVNRSSARAKATLEGIRRPVITAMERLGCPPDGHA